MRGSGGKGSPMGLEFTWGLATTVSATKARWYLAFGRAGASQATGTMMVGAMLTPLASRWCVACVPLGAGVCTSWNSVSQDGGLGRSVYDGEWTGGLFHGTGRFHAPDGRLYEGEVS